jgi:hypothetical protein
MRLPSQRVWNVAADAVDIVVGPTACPAWELSSTEVIADEDIEIKFVSECFSMLSSPGFSDTDKCPDDTLTRLFETLERGSLLWSSDAGNLFFALDTSNSGNGLHVPLIVPVPRERLAKICLSLMFDMSSRASSDHVASKALASAVRTSKRVITKWIEDGPLHLRFPFPR